MTILSRLVLSAAAFAAAAVATPTPDDQAQSYSTVSTVTASASSGGAISTVTPEIPPRVLGYYGNWVTDKNTRNYSPSDVPADLLTHVVYLYGKINPNTGEVTVSNEQVDLQNKFEGDPDTNGQNPSQGSMLYGNINQFINIKAQNRNLKLLFGLGGPDFGKQFNLFANNEESRRRFATTSVNMIKTYGFDGIQIDWQYPEANDKANVIELFTAVREELDRYESDISRRTNSKPYYLLTADVGAAKDQIAALPAADLAKIVDFLNVKAYDFTGPWSPFTGYHSNLYMSSETSVLQGTPRCADDAIKEYLQANVPAEKINLVIPAYGRAFDNTEGLGRTFQGVGQGSWQQGVYDFKALPLAGSQTYYDEQLGASHSYDIKKEFIAYDSRKVAIQKATYVANKKLGGMGVWELSGDKPADEGLVGTITETFGGADKLQQCDNNVNYPDSPFNGVKALAAAVSSASASATQTGSATQSDTATTTATATSTANSTATPTSSFTVAARPVQLRNTQTDGELQNQRSQQQSMQPSQRRVSRHSRTETTQPQG